jgi:putative FmdB family regulatory protein
MPLYEYQCQTCGRRSESLQKMSDPPLTTCEVCGGPLKRLISSPAVQFKGSGWYVTDYAKKSGGAAAGSSKGESAESKSESKSDSASAASKSSESSSGSGGSSASSGSSSSDGGSGSSSGSGPSSGGS